jgi:hypothetical protein
MKSIEIAQEITATMSLRLPGTVGKIANKMRYIDKKAPEFLTGGFIKPIPDMNFKNIKAIGIASISNNIQAFGGILYGSAALRHDVIISGNKVIDTFQDSRIDINDMNYFESKQRLVWKEYKLVYQLLNDLFQEKELPDLIILDLPLILKRTDQSNKLEIEEIKEEWDDVLEIINKFWKNNLSKVFPENPNGPIIISLSEKYFGAAVYGIKEKEKMSSPEEINAELISLIKNEWEQLKEVGILRTLKGLLRSGKRTVSYYYDSLGIDTRAEPKIINNYGLVGLHLQVGVRTPIWQIETLGSREGELLNTQDIDRISSLVSYLTLYDNPKILPLPLWYAKRLVKMPRDILKTYYRETLRLLKEKTIDESWLDDLEAFDDDISGGVNL